MNCKKCGIEIKNGEKFCSNCGERVVFATVANQNNNGTIIRKIDCAKEGVKKVIVMFFLAVTLVVDAVIYMDTGDDTLEMMGKLILVLAIGLVIYCPFVYMNYQKRFCLIKEDGINGVGCGTTDFTNSNYEFAYSEIISVQKKKMLSQVVVQTADKKIGIFLPNKEINSVYEFILQKTRKR